MMMTIMTCVECGAELREWDFLRRRARLIENRPYCTVCKPAIRTPHAEPVKESIPVRGARQLPRNHHLL
jgi:uncharacterized protein with PIN domain